MRVASTGNAVAVEAGFGGGIPAWPLCLH